jgi:hypothetical protein
VRTVRRLLLLATTAAVLLAGWPGADAQADGPTTVEHPPGTMGPRAAQPEDRYALAGGCYAVRSAASGDHLERTGTLTATAPMAAAAEAIHFQATDLGRYLLYATGADFLAADGSATTLAATPSPAADWEIDALDGGGFSIRLPATGASLVADGAGTLALTAGAAAGDAARFTFERVEGCALWPEVEVDVTGPHVVGDSSFEEVTGYLDAHLHITGFQLFGGAGRCGRPWHPYGATAALVDCPDHFPDGSLAIMENLLSQGSPVGTHDPLGWPTFADWPAYDSLTHEQTYYRWIERTWRSGERMIVNLFVENRVLCELYPVGDDPCDEMASVRLQYDELHALERYIDAQNGGPGEGWFRIVTTPEEARRVADEGRLAVVMGMEVSEPFGCGQVLGVPRCTAAGIDAQLDELQAMGIRHVFPIHKFDNALGGVRGDDGSKGVIVNLGQLYGTGTFWDMVTCDPDDTGVHDNDQTLPVDGGAEVTDVLGGLAEAIGLEGTLPVYGPPHHCNTLGLTELGAHAVAGLAARGMLIDVDHMSVLARDAALAQLEAIGYSGVSSHSWSSPEAYPRVLAMGGMVTAYAGGSTGFVDAWRAHREMTDDRYFSGFGFGADMNGLGGQGGPRGADAADPVTYPFTGLGGVVVDRQVSGSRTYDVNVDGVAHYGLYADWIEDLRRLAGDEIVTDLSRGAEAYLQTWERAEGIAAPACRGAAPFTGLATGMTTGEVLRIAGQPQRRQGTTYTYCDGVIEFDAAGRLLAVTASAGSVPPAAGGGGTLPATGGSVPVALAAGLLVLAVVARWRPARRTG